MSLIKMSEGCELTIRIYLVGLVGGLVTEIKLSVDGLTSFSDTVTGSLDISSIVQVHDLDKLGSGWRVMTRDEIDDFRRREREDEDEAA